MSLLIKFLVDYVFTWWKLKQLCSQVKISVVRFFLRGLYYAYQNLNGSSIALSSVFDGEPCFPHGQKSIFISGDAKIGKNCVIFQQVTIGSNTCSDSKGIGAPTIGDSCLIGAGAKIIGNVKIGNNVRIGANAVVFKDVPDDSSVIVGEQRVLQKSVRPDNRFIAYHSGSWFFFHDGVWLMIPENEINQKLNSAFNKS